MAQDFPPTARLHNGREFGRVFYRQQKASSGAVVALLAPRPGSPGQPARLGIMVSTKVSKLAVRRHQLKRWVREWFRLGGRDRLGGCDLVVLIHRDPTERDHAGFSADLERAVSKALAAAPQPGAGRGPKRGRRSGGKAPAKPGPAR